MKRETFNRMSLEEKLDEQLNLIAHIYAVDANDEQDVERYRIEAPSFMLGSFEDNYSEYLQLKREFLEMYSK